MTITELINNLQELKSKYGDLSVKYPVRGPDLGDFYNSINEAIYTKDAYFNKYIIALK